MIAPPRNVLCSFHYFKDYDLDRLPHLRIIGDSGAFSAASQGATITTSDLAAWAHQWRHRLAWVASLDVIGDERATRRNWQDMVEGHGIPGVPTVHFGADPTAVDWYVDQGVDFIGLGGMVGRSTNMQMRWLIPMFRHARDRHPHLRFHGWGVTADKLMHLPFFSVDSSGWTQAVRFGRLVLRDPKSPRDYPVALDGRDAYRPEVARLLREAYGVSFTDATVSTSANRDVIVRLAALSTAVQEQRVRRLHGPISEPEWGRLGDHRSDGLNLSLAAGWTYTAPDRIEGLHTGPHMHMAKARIENADPVNIENLNATSGTTVGPNLHLAVAAKDGMLAELGEGGLGCT